MTAHLRDHRPSVKTLIREELQMMAKFPALAKWQFQSLPTMHLPEFVRQTGLRRIVSTGERVYLIYSED